MKYNITKEVLKKYLDEGMTNRDIAEKIGCGKSNIGHFIHQFGLEDCQRLKKLENYRINKIDSREKAYILGFICCDAAINEKNIVEISVAKNDKEVPYFISNIINSRVFIDDSFDLKTRRFPRARISKKIPDIKTFIGGPSKQNRHLPIANKELTRYVLLGAFDADGCLAWGRRKDLNKLWHKVSFNTSLNIAVCIQKILFKELNISTVVRPKSNHENCYVLEFSNRHDVECFLNYIYADDFIVLKRKYLKAKALRLELEDNGGGSFKK